MASRHDPEGPYEAAHALPPAASESEARTGSHRDIGSRPRRATDASSFRRSLGWAAAGTIVPGLGLLRTRARLLGIAMVAVTAALFTVGALAAFFARDATLTALVAPGVLTFAWVAVAAFGVLWAGSIAATHLMLRPAPARGWQRFLGALVVGVLALAVVTPSFVAARTIRDTSQLIDGVFGDENPATADDEQPFGTPTDPWANKPRLNVLVLGGDAGPDRQGTRTDTVILASIDTKTGATVLFSLPRQTANVPFPVGTPFHDRFPNGFSNGNPLDQGFALNAIYDTIPELFDAGAFGGAEDPGAHALKLAVGEALGLKVDYYAMVNMEGFVEFVNALGGITVNVNVPVPVGGKNPTRVGGSDGFPPDRWLVPGPSQHLNGNDALWFARGRYHTTDYARMSRQRCVIQAVVQQANPTKVLTNYEALTKAGSNIVATDMPNRQLPRMVSLGLRVKDAAMTSVSFENNVDGFSTTSPDWALVRERVQLAINPPAPAPTTAPTTPDAEPTATPAGTATPTATPEPAPPASVVDECAYNPAPWPPVEG